MNKKKLFYFLLVIIWMLIVFIFSNQPDIESSNTSSRFTEFIINVLVGNRVNIEEKAQLIKNFHPILRKFAHFSLYTIGGALIFNYVNTYNINNKKKIAFSIGLGVFYAALDEFHQIFISGRSGQISDVFIDSLGICVGVIILFFIIKLNKKCT